VAIRGYDYAIEEAPLNLCMRSNFRRLLLLVLSATALGLGSGSLRAAEGVASQSSLNDGYSLFYDFCNQESQLSLLLWFKSAPHDIADYATRISATAKDDMAIMKKFSADDSALRLDQVSLPGFEIDVRKSMGDDRKQQLIWGASGGAFAQAVSMTQSEVTNYGLHVAKVLADTDPNPERARAMRAICDKWTALHVEAYKLAR
jgi:hypothetical protein